MGINYAIISITLLILATVKGGEYGDRIKNATETWGPNLEMQESRYHDYVAPYPQTELPIKFQAPYLNAKDYWNEQPRRTVFDREPYFSQDTFTRPITDGISNFYDLMSQFFGHDEIPPRRKPNYNYYPTKPPFNFEKPLYQQPIRQHYLPGPKPVKASVIKLEPTRRPPLRVPPPPIEYTTTTKYYPQFVKLLNDVIIENTYQNQLTPLGLGENAVLERPESILTNIVPTTYKPKKKPFLQKTTPFPESIQDQLPPLKQGQDTRIPYVSEQPAEQNFITTTGAAVIFHEASPSARPMETLIDARDRHKLFTTTSPPVTFTPTILSTTFKPKVGFESTTHGPVTFTPTILSTSFKPKVVFESTTHGETGLRFPKESSTKEPQLSETTTYNYLGQELKTNSKNSSESETTTTAVPFTTVTPETEPQILMVTTLSPETSTMPQEETTTEISTDAITPLHLISQSSEQHPIITELLNTMENTEKIRFKGPFSKKLDTSRRSSIITDSADYVTELTIRGLTGGTAGSVQPLRVNNVINMTTVIGFEIARLNATAPPYPYLDLNDELSLDAKILKDTNWDGFQQPIRSTKKSTTNLSTTTENTLQSTTESFLPTVTPPSIIPTISSTITTASPALTTEFTTLGTTDTPITTTETTDVAATTEEINTSIVSTRVTQTVSRSPKNKKPAQTTTETPRTGRSFQPPNFEEKMRIGAFMTESTKNESELSTLRPRKYHRRAKIQAFTPFPPQILESNSDKPITLGGSRPSFHPKRSRPNATITFTGRKAGRKVDNFFREKEESPSTTKKPFTPRRDLYRKRTYPSQLRRRTTEETMLEEAISEE